jgi:peptidoglycan/xylan/chitin deacetylase (PgdA/CDA1 family)
MTSAPTQPRSVVLCYHAVSEHWPSSLAVRPRQLRAHVAHLLGRGYRPATFSAAVAGRGMLAVTFDDAFATVGTLGLSVLRELGVPGTVFVPTAFPDSHGPLLWPGLEQWPDSPYAGELRCLGWDELAGLADAGWEIGSHTRSHPHLTQLADAALADELERSRAAVEEGLGRPCRSIAYPYGDVDARVVAAARDAGYSVAASLPKGRFARGAPLDWPRVGVYNADDLRRFRIKAARPLRVVRGTPLWDVAAAAARRIR